jgi:hypothetical protein
MIKFWILTHGSTGKLSGGKLEVPLVELLD